MEACPTGARVFGRLDDPEGELARRLATIVAPLDPEEALEVTAVHSVAGLLPEGGGHLLQSDDDGDAEREPLDHGQGNELHVASRACERHYQAFQFVLWAGKSAKEALETANFDTLGEA